MNSSRSRWFSQVASLLTVGAALVGCSHTPSKSDVARAQGPTVTAQKVVPGTIELNRYLQPKQPHEFLVEVHDPMAEVTDVQLKIPGSSVTVPMDHIGTDLWRGTLAEDQISQLATGGKTADYKANIVMRDSMGRVATAKDPLEFKIKAPSLEDRAG